ncbi:MAG: hypothetical protein L6R39_007149 [Caloplaca ligustica]|nr:MAG: hypothetical protein L6R39_007149 [Caloplaca ligustica]
MLRPQYIHSDHNARQQHPRQQARASSRRPRQPGPPRPSVEDEAFSLSHELRPGPPDAGGREACSRGSIDQEPIILDVNPPALKTPLQPARKRGVSHRDGISSESSTSSDESSGPRTPIDLGSGDDKRNRDRRYVFIPHDGAEIPLTYDEQMTPDHPKPSENNAKAEPQRGRKNVPKLDTDLPGVMASHDVPVQLERERSPYRSGPKAKETRISEEYLLSPELLSPKIRRPENPSHPIKQTRRASSIDPGRLVERSGNSSTTAARPPTIRHASAIPYAGEAMPSLMSSTNPGSKTPLRDAFPPTHRSSTMLDRDLPQSPRRSSPVPTLKRQGVPTDHHFRHENTPPTRALSISTGVAPAPAGSLPGSGAQQSLNAMLSSPLFDQRRASPRNSPRSSPVASRSSSPLSSPPRTPSAEAGNGKSSYNGSLRTSGSNSRPSSPLQPPHPAKATNHLDPQDDRFRTQRPAMRSRQTSPLPSAPSAHLQPDSAPRIDIRSPSPARHRRSSTYGGADQRSRSQHPIEQQIQATRDQHVETLKPGVVEPRRRSSSAVHTRPQLVVDSSRAQETMDSAQQRHLGLKSPTATRAASVGAPPATLPPCPRSRPVAGYNDWYSLRDDPTFKICPACRQAVSHAGYGRHLVPAFSKSPERPVQCSFSIPWIRMAYLLMVKKRRSDLSLLYDMADVAEDTPPCPGKKSMAGEWYRIYDVDSDRNVPGFYACPYCIRSLETIFPVLKGVFHKSRSRHSLEERTCSLRSDSSRFATYVDLLEDTANQANEFRRAPNTYRFVELAKKMEAIPPCSRDDMLRGRTWHVIPKLPEFTACSECYEDVVWPAVLQGLPLALQFTRTPQAVERPHVGVSCQMYSSKMRKVFSQACEEDDLDYLRKVALRRYRIERDLQHRIVEAQGLPRAEREGAMEDIIDEWQEWD